MDANLEEKDFDVREIYTPLSVAKEEIWRRWNDKKLRKKVEDFLGGDIPEFLRKEPKAVIGRNIASPNLDFINFTELSNNIGMNCVCIEYLDDKFVAKNKDKYHLCKTFIFNGLGKKGGYKLEMLDIVNFKKIEGKIFREIKTRSGYSLVDFHHELLEHFFEGFSEKCYDLSDWFKKNGGRSEGFYIYYLGLFLVNGILFENYFLRKGGDEFFKKVLKPSLKKIKDIFGISPLIVPIESLDDSMDLRWYCYPSGAKKIFKKHIVSS
jgi:hypothetical protein